MRNLITAALLASAAPAFAQTTPPVLAGTRLDIVARGEVRRTPDIAMISAGVVSTAPTAQAAMADNADRMARVLAALRRAGLAERDIATASVSLQPQYRYAENQAPQVTGYQASNSVIVRFRDIRRAGAILDTLVREGANQINGPNLVIDRPEAALDEARVQAVGQARARADLYARAAGLSVKRIVSISESGDGYAPPPPMPVAMRAMDVSAAKTEIAPGEQAVGVTLSVTFELQ